MGRIELPPRSYQDRVLPLNYTGEVLLPLSYGGANFINGGPVDALNPHFLALRQPALMSSFYDPPCAVHIFVRNRGERIRTSDLCSPRAAR